jgi:hypothetical protein
MASTPGEPPATSAHRPRAPLRAILQYALIVAVTLAVTELALRVFHPQYLQDDVLNNTLGNQYDPDLGWSPIPNSPNHNSLGLRDIEYVPDGRPKILVLGDSMVWGLYVENGQRATDLLRQQMPAYQIVNAGVAGYGTDQEFLMMQRLWDKIRPAVVVVIYTTMNDRADNTQNVRSSTYKPYFQSTPDGGILLQGQPAPKPRRLYFRDNWFAHNFLIVRLAISAYVELRYPRVKVADPTERLVDAIQNFVKARGARLLFGLQWQEPQLEDHLRSRDIPFTRFDGAQDDASHHWTPAGHAEVARRLLKLFSDVGVPPGGSIEPKPKT